MRIIDETTWQRKAHSDFFARIANPIYSITFPLDVTAPYAFAKKEGLSFYYVVMWLCTRAVNRVEAFHYKLRPDGVVLHEVLSPSFTFPHACGMFGIADVDFDMGENLREFCARAAHTQESQKNPLPSVDEDMRDDQIYISCLPWIAFTHLSQETSGDPNDSTPRMCWGKFEEKDGRKIMPMTVQVNHRLIDGAHLGQLKEELDRETANINNE